MTCPETCFIFDIKTYAIHDGPGIRTTVFFKGCPLHCWWCHNPESIHPEPGLIWHSDRCVGCLECARACPGGAVSFSSLGVSRNNNLCRSCGACADVCPAKAQETIGRRIPVPELLGELEKDLLFYESSGGGVTVSGGEPLFQHKALMALLRGLKAQGIHTALDTSGFAPWEYLQAAAEVTDLFLYDLKLMDDEAHRLHTGVSNAIILANLEKLSRLGVEIVIRIPLVHTVNDTQENLRAVGEFIGRLPANPPVELLPFHDMPKTKYAKLNMPWNVCGLDPTTRDQAERASRSLTEFGINVRISGR